MRLIDGDQLKRKAQKVANEAWEMKLTAKVETTLNQFIDWIDAQPTIEPRCEACEAFNKTRLLIPQPQRTGRWELIDDTEFRVPGYRCSVCHCECEDWDKKPTYRFCPNCGARMEGE